MYPVEMLEKAQDFVTKNDDISWFNERYVSYREYFGIKESVIRALISMDIYNKFKDLHNLS